MAIKTRKERGKGRDSQGGVEKPRVEITGNKKRREREKKQLRV